MRETGINAKTAQAYQALFQRMFVLDLVPARACTMCAKSKGAEK